MNIEDIIKALTDLTAWARSDPGRVRYLGDKMYIGTDGLTLFVFKAISFEAAQDKLNELIRK